jgi:hypothetical protein
VRFRDTGFGCVSWRRFQGAFSDGIVGFVGWLRELALDRKYRYSINSSLYLIFSFVAFKSHQFYINRISSSYRVYIVHTVYNNCVRGAAHEQ